MRDRNCKEEAGVRQVNPWDALKSQQNARRRKRAANVAFNAKIAGRPISASRTLLKKQLWAITSLLVRRRDRMRFAGYCLICVIKEQLGLLRRAKNPIQCAYHVFPSGDAAVQYDLRNIVGACHACNDGEMHSRHSNKTSFRQRYEAIHLALLGHELYSELERLAGTTAQHSTADLKQMYDERKAQLEGR